MNNFVADIISKIKKSFSKDNLIEFYKRNKDHFILILTAIYLIIPFAIIYKAIEESEINLILQFILFIVAFFGFWILFMICKIILLIIFLVCWVISLIYVYQNFTIEIFVICLCLFVFVTTIWLYDYLKSIDKEG